MSVTWGAYVWAEDVFGFDGNSCPARLCLITAREFLKDLLEYTFSFYLSFSAIPSMTVVADGVADIYSQIDPIFIGDGINLGKELGQTICSAIPFIIYRVETVEQFGVVLAEGPGPESPTNELAHLTKVIIGQDITVHKEGQEIS